MMTAAAPPPPPIPRPFDPVHDLLHRVCNVTLSTGPPLPHPLPVSPPTRYPEATSAAVPAPILALCGLDVSTTHEVPSHLVMLIACPPCPQCVDLVLPHLVGCPVCWRAVYGHTVKTDWRLDAIGSYSDNWRTV